MRRLLKWLGGVLVTLGLAGLVVGLWKREEINRLLAVNSLFTEQRIVANFSGMKRAFLTVPVPRGHNPVSHLRRGPELALPVDVSDWIEARAVTSLLVLHRGRIVHESYRLNTNAEDHRISWSLAKSFLASLVGISLERGEIASLDDPVTAYAPRLAGSAYESVTLRQLLQMTGGLEFDEDYLDYQSDINRMGRVLALGGSMDGFAAGRTERAAPPGTRWNYVSIDSHALAMALRGATGRTLPDLLSERIVAPLGLETPPYYLTDGEGVAFALGGLNMITRDYGRFGLMVAQMGRYNGQQIVPADWIAASTVPSTPTPAGEPQYGLHWWMPEDAHEGEFYAHGIYGQYIYVDRFSDVVIVVTAADRAFRDPGVRDANIKALRSIVSAL